MNGRKSALIAWVIVLVFFIAWETGVRLFNLPVYLLPSPSKVFVTLSQNVPMYWSASLITLGEALTGLVLGLLTGFLLASALVMKPGLEGGVITLAILVKSTPMVAIAPLLTIWLGFGTLPKVLITALLTFFPALVNILSGLSQPDPALLDLFHSWDARRRDIFLNLRLPSALPHIFTSLKICAPLAMIGAVVAEWTGASGGLGRVMWLAYTNLNLPYLFGAIFILAVFGVVIYWSIDRLEKRVVFWQVINDFEMEK